MRLSRFLRLFGRSLTAKLAVAAVIFVAAITAVHVLSLDRLFVAERSSSEVRGRWLDSIRYLGELNAQISDMRTMEADLLLARDGGGPAGQSAALDALAEAANTTMGRYRGFPHDQEETAAFDRFARGWGEHVQHAQKIATLVRDGSVEAAISLFDGPARSSFADADQELGGLIELTTREAEAARQTTAAIVSGARRWVSDLILGILALFLLLAAYLWWGVSQPILALGGLMQRLGNHDTEFSIPFERRADEIGELARILAVFRRNTIELLESRRRLSSEAARATETLQKERALATEQRNFMTTISHEFRTPLMAIDGNAQRLITLKEQLRPPDIADRAKRIRTAVFRMTSLVASLMNSAELAGRDFRARLQTFDLKDMLGRLAHYYDGMAIGGGLEADIDGAPDRMIGDQDLLYQVVSNLLSNAFKYSPGGTIVSLRATVHDRVVRITVSDRGIGIPRKEIERVRERYYRGSNVNAIPGGGLGLHLVNEIVRQHGGRIEIESEEGKGTRVAVLLPVEGPDGPVELP